MKFDIVKKRMLCLSAPMVQVNLKVPPIGLFGDALMNNMLVENHWSVFSAFLIRSNVDGSKQVLLKLKWGKRDLWHGSGPPATDGRRRVEHGL